VRAILICESIVISIRWHSRLKQYLQLAWTRLFMKPQMDLLNSEMAPVILLT